MANSNNSHHHWSLYLRMYYNGPCTTAKDRPVSLLSVVGKVFEKLANNRIADHLEKCGLFSDFQYGFKSSRSTADLFTVVSDRIARVFNWSGATRAVAIDMLKASEFCIPVFFTNSVTGQVFGLVSSFLSNRRLRLVLNGKSSQEYSVNAGVPQGSIIDPTLFLLYTNDFLMMLSVILLSMLVKLLSTLSVFRHLTCGNS